MISWNGYGGMGLGIGFMILGFLFMLALIAGVVLFIIWLVKQSNSHDTPNLSAVDILKIRYAKGEIDKTEFDEKMKTVSK
jgi:putative membrane protein